MGYRDDLPEYKGGAAEWQRFVPYVMMATVVIVAILLCLFV